MKIFSKTMAVILSAVMILTCAVPAASAAKTAACPQIRVIRCQGSGCADIQKLMDRLCNGSICLSDILRCFKGCCPGSNVCVPVPDAPVQNPSETPSEPTAVPTEPAEKPTEPTVIPTEPNIPTEPVVAPTEPAAVPTEPAAVPTEPAAVPTEPVEISTEQAPTEKPTVPVIVPTEPVAEPTEPIVAPTEEVTPEQPDSAGFNTAYEAQVLRLVNIERAKYGLAQLSMDDGAVKVAHLRAKEIVQSFSHTRPDGSSCFTAAKEFGVAYRTAGENIAYGYPNPEQVVNGWMNSEGHRKNILSASFSKIGIGCYESRGVLYWSQFFIG